MDSKVFFWSIGSNPWGRYLRISENGAGCALASTQACLSFNQAPGRGRAQPSRCMRGMPSAASVPEESSPAAGRLLTAPG